MSKIQKIIINAEEYTLSDGGAVVFDAAQTLTDAQKTQARENIGANTLTVTITDGTASHTSAEIYAHVQAGGTAVLENADGYFCPLVGSYGDYATFEHTHDDDLRDNIVVYADGSVENREYQNLSTDAIDAFVKRPTTAEVGQVIVVKTVDANGKPTDWECVDLPSGGNSGSNLCGIVTAFFEGQDESIIYCTSQDHDTLLQDIETYPTIAHITITTEYDQKVITTMCWVDENRTITVGDYFGDSGWKWYDGNSYLSEY